MFNIKYLFIFIIMLGMSGCTNEDHTKQMKKIITPLALSLQEYKNKHSKIPSKKTIYAMIEKLGCKIHNDTCNYKGLNITINAYKFIDSLYNDKNSTVNYHLKITQKNNICFIKINKNEKKVSSYCYYNDPSSDIVHCDY